MVGLEHEYSLSIAGQAVDFRDLIHDLAVPGRRLDPGDINAYRCSSGLVVTCDAADAEVVSPPLAVRPGFTVEVSGWAAHGRAELARLLPREVTVTPFSTHLSASMPEHMVVPVCDLFARTFAPALMLMLDGADSHGVFVRPRPGRIELCGEHVMGARLGAAAALVAGGARACAAALGAGDAHLPPLLDVDVRPATGRHGLFVGRHLAFGYDLYAAGRQARLPLLAGGVMDFQDHLGLAWEAARAALTADAGDRDFKFGDAMVSGSAPLGVERPAYDGAPQPWWAPLAPSPFGAVVQARRRPGFEAVAVAATWGFTVFRLTSSARHAYACVPGGQLGSFLERIDAGLLDGLLGGFLEAAPTGRVLAAHDETAEAGLWDEALIGPDLLPYERGAADGDEAGLLLPPSVPIGMVGQAAAPTYARRGKTAVVATPAPPRYRHIAAAGPVAGAEDLHRTRVDPPPSVPLPPRLPPPPAPPLPAPVEAPGQPPAPLGSPGRRRRRAGVLVGVFLVVALVAGAAALTGMLGGGKRTEVSIRTSPPVTTDVTVEPPTTGRPEPTTTARLDATAPPAPPTLAPTVPSTAVNLPTSVPRPPTTAVTVPAPTVTSGPVVTAAPVETTVPPTVTTVSVPPLTQVVVAVTSGALGCAFQPSSANAVAGSTIRFRNDIADGISVSVAPPTGAMTRISLDAGSTSSGYSLSAPGTYAVTCTPGGDGLVGRMTVTVTSP